MSVRLAPVLYFLALSIALGETYRSFLSRSVSDVWALAAVNGIFATLIVLTLERRPSEETRLAPVWQWWLPHVGVLLVLLVMGLCRSRPPVLSGIDPSHSIASVLVVPVVEEFVFRGGVGGIFRRLWPGWMGYYGAALFFAFAHSLPALSPTQPVNWALPVGPLVLGISCEILYKYSGRLYPAILLHSLCNASGILYIAFAPQGLDWLTWFYL